MNIERLQELFKDEELQPVTWKGDNAFQGLQIIAKYINPMEKDIICGAEHDELFSVYAEELIEAGITEEDVIKLVKFNWMYDAETNGLACYV